MYPAALFGRGLADPAQQTLRASCLACHGKILAGVITVGRLRIKHSTCASGPTCDTCHSTVAHGKAVRWAQTPVMQDCVACHTAQGASVACETCHTGTPGERTTTTGPWQVTHGPDWRTTHGLGDTSTCVTCHPGDFCVKCHKVQVPHPVDFGASHGAAALADTASCLVCHTSRAQFCDTCHGMEMPHPAGFLKAHSKIAKGVADPACQRCHDNADCDTCHANHVHPGGSTGLPIPWTTTPESRRP
jgi:hypothetical protein